MSIIFLKCNMSIFLIWVLDSLSGLSVKNCSYVTQDLAPDPFKMATLM